MSTEPNLNEQDYELLSAFIDGMLNDEERKGLQARLMQEPALRRELSALRQTVALVRQLPPLKAPRNFTLTPDMVAEARITPPAEGQPALRIPSITADVERMPAASPAPIEAPQEARRRTPIIFPALSVLSAVAAMLLMVFGFLLLTSEADNQNGASQEMVLQQSNSTFSDDVQVTVEVAAAPTNTLQPPTPEGTLEQAEILRTATEIAEQGVMATMLPSTTEAEGLGEQAEGDVAPLAQEPAEGVPADVLPPGMAGFQGTATALVVPERDLTRTAAEPFLFNTQADNEAGTDSDEAAVQMAPMAATQPPSPALSPMPPAPSAPLAEIQPEQSADDAESEMQDEEMEAAEAPDAEFESVVTEEAQIPPQATAQPTRGRTASVTPLPSATPTPTPQPTATVVPTEPASDTEADAATGPSAPMTAIDRAPESDADASRMAESEAPITEDDNTDLFGVLAIIAGGVLLIVAVGLGIFAVRRRA